MTVSFDFNPKLPHYLFIWSFPLKNEERISSLRYSILYTVLLGPLLEEIVSNYVEPSESKE